MKWRLLVLVFLIIALALAAWSLSHHLHLQQIASHEQELRQTIERHPITAFAIALVVNYVLCLVPGTSGKTIAMGWFFGFWRALLIAEASLVLAAVTMFTFSRFLFAGYIRRRWQRWMALMDNQVRKEGAFYLLTLRLMHAPYTAINYLAGASCMPLKTFVWTTALGMLPGNVVFALLGSHLPTLREVAKHGPHSLLRPWLIVTLGATAVLPYAGRWIAKKWLKRRARLAGEPSAAKTSA
ncbi:MAG: hypothetical protein KatS3mg111_3371 [Pirellulaceae bacterium]|nr:MAG: hypothetical protein KatS3mg111_3371 [Pirellulaceae bacterium]